MVGQTSVSPNSLITIAHKWIMKYCKFSKKKKGPSVNEFN